MKISKNVGFFLLLFFLLFTPLLISILPFIIQSIHTPPDRVFMGLHRWSEDYYGYLHLINQGLNGHLMTVNKITNEIHIPAFIHSEYSFLGLLGRIIGINSVLTYHLSRLILGGIFLFTSLFFFINIFKFSKISRPATNSLLAIFLAFFIGGFPHITDWQTLQIEPYLSWWVELDTTRRSTILPHYLMGNIFMCLILVFFLKITNTNFTSWRTYLINNGKYLLLLGLFSFLLAFVHPVDFTLTISILGFFLFLRLVTEFFLNLLSLKKTLPVLFISFPALIIIFLLGLLPILYFRYIFTLPFYRFIAEHGTTTPYNIPLLEFVLALGPVFFLAILGIIFLTVRVIDHLIHKLHQFYPSNPILLMFSWFVVQTIFFFFGYQILNFDRLRSLHAPFFIPLAFFATLFLLKIERKIKIGNLSFNTKYLMLLAGFLITFPLSVQSIYKQVFEVSDFKSFSTFSYPSKKTYEAFLFLKNNTPENSFITTAYEARFLLPGVANNKVALGANFENDTVYKTNMEKVIMMYQGVLKGDQLRAFLKSQNINYLYWDYQEKSYGGDLTKENFLTKIFDNGQVTVFAVK